MGARHEFYKPDLHGKLPPELADQLNQAYILHMLVLEPAKILPPGKSLLSMMTRTTTSESQRRSKSAWQTNVEGIVHRAFWDEALESLSSPLPSKQLPRLKLIYSDLLTTLNSLLPPNHPVLQSLAAPLAPTSSPLQSSLFFLKEILLALRQRCAPIRDAEIDDVLKRMDKPIPHQPDTQPPVSKLDHSLEKPPPPISPSAQRVIDIIRSILHLAEIMKEDLNQFVLGAMSEEQLKEVILQQAKVHEREAITSICNWSEGANEGQERMKEMWKEWTDDPLELHFREMQQEDSPKWILRLVQALGSTIPISCNASAVTIPAKTYSWVSNKSKDHSIVSSTGNFLPPQFIFSAPTLFYIQNYLQALVIAACLRSLTRLPPQSRVLDKQGDDFMQRVWTLLRAEIDGLDTVSEATKIVNLADEVVRARQSENSCPPIPYTLTKEEESRLRSAVERTLLPHDPVFVLLQKRLLTVIAKGLVDFVTNYPPGGSSSSSGAGHCIPDRMQSGRERPSIENERPGKRIKLTVDPGANSGGSPEVVNCDGKVKKGFWRTNVRAIKGFEDPVLEQAVEEGFNKLASCVEWTLMVWSSMI